MIDSIYIRSAYAKPGKSIIWESSNRENRKGRIFRYGKLENLDVKQDLDGRLSIAGSIPKYFKGSNLETLSREELITALDKLTKEAGIEPEFTRVFRMEVAVSVPMPRTAIQYMSVLGDRPRFEKCTFSNGVMYRGYSKSLSFYDKGHEAKSQENRLRIELKLKNRLKKELGFPVFLMDLYNLDFLKAIVQLLVKEYNKVGKIKRQVLEAPTGTKDLSRQLNRIAIECLGGEEVLLRFLSKSEMGSQARSRCKQMVRTLCRNGNLESDQLLIQEMDEEFQLAVEQALSS